MKLFDVDGPLMAALNKLADLVFANLLFILFSLPVVTLGASLTALQTVVLRLPLAAGMLAVPILAVHLSFFLNPDLFGGALFLWLAVGFALVAYLNAFLALRAFRVLPDSGEN